MFLTNSDETKYYLERSVYVDINRELLECFYKSSNNESVNGFDDKVIKANCAINKIFFSPCRFGRCEPEKI